MIEHEPDPTVFERRDPLIGHTLDDRFRIDARLAAGGFGAIYRAADLRAGRDVALKILHPTLAADPALVARFRREATTLASLRSPHTVTAYDLGETGDGTLYIAMELLRGETLYEAFRKEGPLPWRRVAHVARAVCSSLAEAHERGIVHRDLKPANIYLQERDGQRDFVKVLDFGIAKVLHGGGLGAGELTVAGQMIGTFDYMAPEQMLGGEVGAPCDLYTLGVVMYEMITGRRPFADATGPTQLLTMLLTTPPPPVAERAQVPPALDRVVMRCLEREPQDRYQRAADLAEALGRALASDAPEEATLTFNGARPPSGEVRAQGSQPAIVPAGRPPVLPHAAAPAPAAPACRRAPAAPPCHLAAPAAYPRHAAGPVDPRAPFAAMAAHAAPHALPTPAPAPGRAALPRFAPYAPHPVADARGSRPYVDPCAPHPVADARGSRPYVDPCAPHPVADARGSRPYVDPYAPHPVADTRSAQPYFAPYAPGPFAPAPGPSWQPGRPAMRGDACAFDAARDAAVRRVVWAFVFVLGFVLALVAAQLL